LTLTGLNGRSGNVLGLVDSGADTTSLPFGYASLMGYSAATLTKEDCGQVVGTATAYRATHACKAIVPEAPGVEIEMLPLFVAGSEIVLWGRRDFMRRFEVLISESHQRFSITPI
jgi:hypothetical protein